MAALSRREFLQASATTALALPAGVRPDLEARADVRLASGRTVPVRTVFSLLRDHLDRFTPDHAAKITGVSPAVIRRFARDFARARSAMIIAQFGACKNYHSDLIQRAQILLASLTGNLGRAGGGWHSFTLTSGHTRWSIHAIWRDHALMLRLQRGEPVVFVNESDARSRGIADHDLVRVWNDLGSFTARAKLSRAIRPAQVHIFHAWEPYQFHAGVSHQSIIASPLKVTQLVGDYGHLHWAHAHYEPNQVDRDTRVDLTRAGGHDVRS